MRIDFTENSMFIDKEFDGLSIDDIANYYFSLDIKKGFIDHPPSIPLKAKSKTNKILDMNNYKPCLGLGIRFYSNKSFFLNERLQICITIKDREHCFYGDVVLIENLENQFLIGVWLNDVEAVKRLRALQQYCHLENYIREKHANNDSFISDKKWSDFLHNVFPSI